MSIEILRQEKGWVIVRKPIGADSEDKGEGCAPALVREALGCGYAEPCHRLDKVASGALLVATDKSSAARLGNDIAGRRIKKEYLCVCEGSFSEEELIGEMQDLLYYDRQKQKSYPVKKPRHGVKDASLSYNVLGRAVTEDGRDISLVWVELHTGRTHQIRVQFASRKHPLLGDGKYGSRDKSCTVALLCHAITADGIRTVCEPEKCYPWNMFYNSCKAKEVEA